MENNQVNNPSHYCQVNGVDCLSVIKSIGATSKADPYNFFLWASAFQYIWRAWHKGEALQNLEKASFYLNRLIERLKNGN